MVQEVKTIFKYQQESGDYLTIDLYSVATTVCYPNSTISPQKIMDIALKNSDIKYLLMGEKEISAFYEVYLPFIDAFNEGSL